MIDRSQFIDEIRRNPAILNRIASIVYGEVGNAPIEKQMIQAESIFNRAIARGQTLDQVTQTHYTPGDKGYYPPPTLARGDAAMADPRTFAQFRDKVLSPVIGGSDIGTAKLGFAPTGNASDSGLNKYGEPYATGRAARNEYARTRWYLGGEKTGGKLDEMYVQEKTPLDHNERLDALRKGGPQPSAPDLPGAGGPVATNSLPDVNYATPRRTPQEQFAYNELQKYYGGKYQPPGVVNTVNEQGQQLADQVPLPPTRPGGAPPRPAPPADTAAPPAAPSTGDLLAGTATPNASAPGSAWEPTNAEQQFITAGASTSPAPDGRPAPPAPAVAAAPQSTTTVSARTTTPAPAAGTLGERMIAAMGPRGAGRSTYIDPATDHQILNPGGSGEEAMGITRDLGRPNATQTSRSAAPSNNPRASGPPSPGAPPPERSPGLRDLAPPQYTRATVPDILAPKPPGFDATAFDNTPTPQSPTIDLGPRLAEGPTPLSAIDAGPRRSMPDILAGNDARMGLAPTAPSPTQHSWTDWLGALGHMHEALYGKPGDPPLVDLMRQQKVDDAFAPGARNAAFPLAPEAARMLAGPPGSASLNLPKSLESPSASSSFGGSPTPLPFQPRTVSQQLTGLSPFEPGVRPPAPEPVAFNEDPQLTKALGRILNRGDQTAQYPGRNELQPIMRPRQSQPMGDLPVGAGPRPGPELGSPMGGYPEVPPANAQIPFAQVSQSPTTNTANLSPFEQWPPPWWNTGGGGDWGGGGGFGGGFDFGAFA